MQPSRLRVGWFGLVMLLAAAEAGAATVALVPNTTVVVAGHSVEIAVVVSGLGHFASPSVGAFDLVIQFDPSVFAYAGLAFGLALGDPMAAEALASSTVTPGNVNVIEISLLPPANLNALQPSSFTLATLTFDAVASGSGVFDVSANALSDETGGALAVGPLLPTTVGVQALSIPVLPAWGMLLLAMLLSVVAVFSRRRMPR